MSKIKIKDILSKIIEKDIKMTYEKPLKPLEIRQISLTENIKYVILKIERGDKRRVIIC